MKEIDPTNILFVCTGNTCRSPMAEALFNRIGENSAWFATSAGLAAEKDQPAAALAIEAMKKFGISLGDHRSKQLERRMVHESELILTMNETQRDLMRAYFPEKAESIFTVGEYACVDGEVVDPFGYDLSFYEQTAEQLNQLITVIFRRLTENLECDKVEKS